MSDNDGRFKPGQSGNPNGRPRLPDNIKRLKRMNSIEVDRLLNEFMSMTKQEIESLMNDPDTPVLKQIVGQVCLKAAVDGDHIRLNFLLDRTAGTVKKEVDLNVIPRPVVIEKIDGGSVELTAIAREVNDEVDSG